MHDYFDPPRRKSHHVILKVVLVLIGVSVLPVLYVQMTLWHLRASYDSLPRRNMIPYAYTREKFIPGDGTVCYRKANDKFVGCFWDRGQDLLRKDNFPLGFSLAFFCEYRSDKVSKIYYEIETPNLTI